MTTGCSDPIPEIFRRLLYDLRYTSGSYGVATLTDSEGKTLLHSDRMDQLDAHLNVIARHAHLGTIRQIADTRYVRRTEVRKPEP